MWNDIIQAVATVGFPIVACGAMAIGYYKATIKFADTMDGVSQDHKDEVVKLITSIDNNTRVMEKVLDKLED